MMVSHVAVQNTLYCSIVVFCTEFGMGMGRTDVQILYFRDLVQSPGNLGR